MPTNWSKSEVEAAVEDYFNMLRLELTGASPILGTAKMSSIKTLPVSTDD